MRPSMMIGVAAKLLKPGPTRDVLILASATEAVAETIEQMVAMGHDTSPAALAKFFRERTSSMIASTKKVPA